MSDRRVTSERGPLRLEELERRDLLSGEPVLLQDINLTPRGSGPEQFVEVGGAAFFFAHEAATGRELWKSDGTQAGTVLVKDLIPGPDDFVDHKDLTDFNGTLFFWATDDDRNRDELWTSDGTDSGTQRIPGITRTNYCGGYAATENGDNFVQVGDTLFFRADDGPSSCALWKTNGAVSGVTRVGDVRSHDMGYYDYPYAYYLTNGEGTLFFASQSTAGAELWKSDGTEAGSVLLKDFGGDTPRFLFDLTSVGGSLYFLSYSWGHRLEFWKSDGTPSGTVLVKDIAPAGSRQVPASTTVVGDELFFEVDDGISGKELWKIDGTEAGTYRLKDISVGATGSNPLSLINAGGALYFTADDGQTGRELWKSDGTEAGTVRVSDINLGATSSNPTDLTVFNGMLYFAADDGLSGTELWKSDGTAAGTVRVTDIAPGAAESNIKGLANVNGTLYFSADDGQTGSELWKSDGTDPGTALVKDIWEGTWGAYIEQYVRPFVELDGSVYFRADDFETSEYDIWRTDGTPAGTVGVVDAWPNDPNFNPGGIRNVNGQLLIFGGNGTSFFPARHELWKSDGTQAGTGIVRDLGTSRAKTSTVFDDTLYFSLEDAELGAELWKSDGTEAGTVLIKDIFPGPSNSYPRDFIDAAGTLFFTANDGANVRKLWKSDGTPNGTVRVKDIHPRTAGPSGEIFAAVGSIVYFDANDGFSGVELWRSDGTEAGTYLVKDIVPGTANGLPDNLTSVDDTLYFTVRGELWKSDGTETGTIFVRNLRPGTSGRFPQDLTNIGGTLFFNGWDAEAGVEIWKSDGTAEGTVRVKDITPGVNAPVARNFTDVNGTLFFVTDDGATGFELWKSDGTEAGTVRVEDIWPGSLSSNPNRLTHFDGALYFTADDGYHGAELWALHPPVGDFDRNHYLNARDIDLMFAAIGSAAHEASFDLTGDGLVNQDDLAHLVESILETDVGDANLDGHVDRQDVAVVAANFGRTDSPGWRGGDFNGDGVVSLSDLLLIQPRLTPAAASAGAIVLARTRHDADDILPRAEPAAEPPKIAARRTVARAVDGLDRSTARERLESPQADQSTSASLRAVRRSAVSAVRHTEALLGTAKGF